MANHAGAGPLGVQSAAAGQQQCSVETLLGGREIAGIFSSRSGEPINITQPCASEWHCRPDHSGSSVAPIYSNWEFNHTTRCVVGARCSILYLNVDLALSKNFKVGERMNLQVRADMFNSLNHVNYGGPSSDVTSATFGEINGAGGMRVVQFNARFTW